MKFLNYFLTLYVCLGLISCNKLNKLDERCSQQPKYLKSFELPDGLIGYNSYELALECSKKTNKPLAIYFTGFNCVNCKKFEDNFLYQKEVKKLLNDNFIFALLYLDDKRALPKESQIEVKSKYSGKIRTVNNIGQLNASLVNKYEHSSQPSLFIANSAEETISLIQYNPNKEVLLKQLKDAILSSVGSHSPNR